MTDAQKVAEMVDTYGVTATPARMLAILFEAAGRTLAEDTIAARMRDLSAEYPSRLAIYSAIKDARRGLQGSEYRIETIVGLGWRLVRHTPGEAPSLRHRSHRTAMRYLKEGRT